MWKHRAMEWKQRQFQLLMPLLVLELMLLELLSLANLFILQSFGLDQLLISLLARIIL